VKLPVENSAEGAKKVMRHAMEALGGNGAREEGERAPQITGGPWPPGRGVIGRCFQQRKKWKRTGGCKRRENAGRKRFWLGRDLGD